MTDTAMETLRILAVDDEIDILESYTRILMPDTIDNIFQDINAKGSELFNDCDEADKNVFELVTCQQGDKAVDKIKNSLTENNPFAVVFLDVRMPPGPDGVWTAQQIHNLDPSINIVIVTGYSDVPPQVISENFATPARLFYIQKPFHWDEIYQFAVALGENWLIQRQLTRSAAELKKKPENDSAVSESEMGNIQDLLARNIYFQEELNLKTRQVEEINMALRVLLKEKERDKRKIEESVRFNINEYISPYLTKLRNTELTKQQNMIVSVIEENLSSLTSTFSSTRAPMHLSFTPVELQVAKLIKHGHTTKEIAELLSLSILTIESYRKSIRKKMGLTNKKENLRTTLLEYL